MGLLMNAIFGASAINALLLLGLVFLYARSVRQTRSQFAINLLLFSLLLLIQNLFAVYSFITMMPFYTSGLEPYVFLYTIIQTAALLAFSWSAWS